jgi:hypothetical protein
VIGGTPAEPPGRGRPCTPAEAVDTSPAPRPATIAPCDRAWGDRRDPQGHSREG